MKTSILKSPKFSYLQGNRGQGMERWVKILPEALKTSILRMRSENIAKIATSAAKSLKFNHIMLNLADCWQSWL